MRAFFANNGDFLVASGFFDVQTIRWVGIGFMTFGVLYLIYRWFQDR